ncbi:MAG: molybdenum cofactor biosynthesis protein MoaE [Deltaproteobacteria bacterium]|nr:molybdenum cofactor biosynthesis protein MoaE [Deltaproteobacteria bacterium]
MEIVTNAPLDPGRLFEQIRKYESGSVLFHYAVVKSKTGDKISAGILFEKNGDMEAELADISADIKSRWNVDDVLLVRRIGTLKIGDLIFLVAVSSQASNDAFEACRFGLERLKKMISIKKTEMLQNNVKSLSENA